MSKNIKQIILPLITSLIWGAAFLFQGTVAEILPPFFVNFVRSSIAFIALLFVNFFVNLYKRRRNQEVKVSCNNKKLFFGGISCGVTLFIAVNLQQRGMVNTTSAEAAFITTMYMVFVPILSSIFAKKTGLNLWVAIVIDVVGLACICEFYEFSLNLSHLFLLGSAIFFAIQIILVDYFVSSVDGIKLSAAQFAVTAILSGVSSLLFEKVQFVNVTSWILPFVFLGVFSSAGGYTLQIVSQKGTNPTLVSLLLSLESLFALFIEIVVSLITKTAIQYTVIQYFGCVLMLIAIVISQIDPFKRKNNQEKNNQD